MKLLRSFDRRELTRLERFLKSDFFNTNLSVVLFYEFLLKYAPGFDDQEMTKEAAYKHIYKDKPFNAKGLNKLRTTLRELIENFLVIEQLKQDKFTSALYLLRAYEERHLENEFNSVVQSVEKTLDKQPRKDVDYFKKRFELEKEKNRYKSSQLQKFDYDLIDDLDRYYYTEKMVYLCSRKSKAILQGEDADMSLEPNPQFTAKEKMVYEAFETAKDLLSTTDSQASFFKLRDIVFQYPTTFSRNSLNNLCTYLQNSTRALFPTIHQSYLQLYLLYKFQQEQKIFDDYNFNAGMFRNIVLVALHLNDTLWLEGLLNTREEQIKVFDDGQYEFAKAQLHFANAQYAKAEEMLSAAEDKVGDTEKAFLYPLKIQLFYETDRQIAPLCNSYKTLLHRLADRLLKREQHIISPFRHFNNVIRRISDFSPLVTKVQQLDQLEKIELELYKNERFIPHQFWIESVLERLLPNNFGKILQQQRALLKEDSTEHNTIKFRGWLDANQEKLTSSQLEANHKFADFVSTPTLVKRAQILYESVKLADRQYGLTLIRGDLKTKL